MNVLPYFGIAGIAYLIGAIPTGAILGRIYGRIDLTALGSGSTGATNAMRFLGPGAGVLVLLGDLGKGMLAVWLAIQIVGTPAAAAIAAFLCVFGHTRSIFLQGRGGRGVVTGLGSLAVAAPGVFVAATLTGCVVAAVTRYISLGSICGAVMTIVATTVGYATAQVPLEISLSAVASALVVLIAHRDNVGRLRDGTERRIGEKITPAGPAG